MFFPIITPPLPVIQYVDRADPERMGLNRHYERLLEECRKSKSMILLNKNGQLTEVKRKALIKYLKLRLKQYAKKGLEM